MKRYTYLFWCDGQWMFLKELLQSLEIGIEEYAKAQPLKFRQAIRRSPGLHLARRRRK